MTYAWLITYFGNLIFGFSSLRLLDFLQGVFHLQGKMGKMKWKINKLLCNVLVTLSPKNNPKQSYQNGMKRSFIWMIFDKTDPSYCGHTASLDIWLVGNGLRHNKMYHSYYWWSSYKKYSDSMYMLLWAIKSKKGGLLSLWIPYLLVYILKTPLKGRISINPKRCWGC